MRKPTMWFPNRSDKHRSVQVQRMARSEKFWVQELYYPCSENKGTDQFCSYYTADLGLLISHVQNVGFLIMWLI